MPRRTRRSKWRSPSKRYGIGFRRPSSRRRSSTPPGRQRRRHGEKSPMSSLDKIVKSYDDRASLDQAWTIPAPWYVDAQVGQLERRTVFSRNWVVVGRADQVAEPGQYVTAQVAGEPILVVRGEDRVVRGFFNVCRHH